MVKIMCFLCVFLQVLSSLKCSLYAGYFKLNKFPTFMIFLIFSNNPIAGCDFASPGPPDLEHIWGPTGQPVYRLFYITIICNFYEIYAFSKKTIEGCDLASLWPPNLEHNWGPKWQPVYGLLKITKKK